MKRFLCRATRENGRAKKEKKGRKKRRRKKIRRYSRGPTHHVHVVPVVERVEGAIQVEQKGLHICSPPMVVGAAALDSGPVPCSDAVQMLPMMIFRRQTDSTKRGRRQTQRRPPDGQQKWARSEGRVVDVFVKRWGGGSVPRVMGKRVPTAVQTRRTLRYPVKPAYGRRHVEDCGMHCPR